MTREEIIKQIANKDFRHIHVEGFFVRMFKEYNIDNMVVALRLLYSGMLSVGFLQDEEAAKLLEQLTSISSYELKDMLLSVLDPGVVEYYEEMLKIEFSTSLAPINTHMMQNIEELEEAVEEAQKALDNFESKIIN